MQLIEVSIPDETAYLIPIGDLHRGDKSFGKAGKAKLQGYLEWVQERPNARIFLMGDVLNVASRDSKTNPFESESGDDEYESAVELFRPVAPQIIGAITGNHEDRMSNQFGFNPLKPFCRELGIPYLGYSAIIKVRVGLRPKSKNQFWNIYHVYAHHTTGGGGTIGAALNRKVKLQEIVQGVDVYMGGHTHQLSTAVRTVYEPTTKGVRTRKVHYIDTGSYLDWEDSYAEAKQMPPGKLGSPRIRFDGRRGQNDVHVSL
jgi:hypothetical protein